MLINLSPFHAGKAQLKNPEEHFCQAEETEPSVETQDPTNVDQVVDRVHDARLDHDNIGLGHGDVNNGNFLQNLVALFNRVKVIFILVVDS